MRSVLLAKLLTVKGAAVAAATVAASGAAVAAATVLPPSSPSGRPAAQPNVAAPAAADAEKGSPSPSLAGLCQAVEAMPSQARVKALESAAFQALIAAAGGNDEVTQFCATLTPGVPQKADPAASHPARPSVPANPPTASRPGAHPSTPGRP